MSRNNFLEAQFPPWLTMKKTCLLSALHVTEPVAPDRDGAFSHPAIAQSIGFAISYGDAHKPSTCPLTFQCGLNGGTSIPCRRPTMPASLFSFGKEHCRHGLSGQSAISRRTS